MNNAARSLLSAAALLAISSISQAGVILSSPHQAVADNQRNQMIRTCVDAFRSEYRGAGLVLSHRANFGYTAEGKQVLTVNGTVWEDGERVTVLKQCSKAPGSNQIAVYTETSSQVAQR